MCRERIRQVCFLVAVAAMTVVEATATAEDSNFLVLSRGRRRSRREEQPNAVVNENQNHRRAPRKPGGGKSRSILS